MIVVTAPTGQIGHQVVDDLLAAGQDVRVVVRDASKLGPGVRERVDVVEGSHGDVAVIGRALDGADALFWLVPPEPAKTMDEAYLDFTRPAAEAIRQHGVKRVVSITALGRGTEWQDRAGLVTTSIRMDDMLMATGAAFRGLAMPSFMENNARQAGAMKEKGMFFGPIDADRKLPWTATRDMAAAAARLLADDSWSGQEEVPLVGPEELSMNDIAAIISDVSDRTVRYQQIPWEQFKGQFLGRGATESFAQGYVDMYRAKGEGMDNAAAERATSRAPTTFRQWAEETLKPALAS